MRLVLVGPPGCGKGTQAERLCDRLGLNYIGTGNMFREAIKQNTPVGQIAKPLIDRGLLVPDTVVNDLVAELFRAKRPERFVMDGYPRTYAQAIAFDSLLAQQFLHLHAVIHLTISDDEVVRRISSRRCCENKGCAVCFNLAFRPPKKEGVCDKCGGKLMLRDDDKEETIRRRLVEFHRNNDALVEHYRRAGVLTEVSAVEPPDVVYEHIRRLLPDA
ncbi:MAG: adenylate kinase [Fimbriiglobus sp.]|nr:adenylate kinase [Fimbriiglobus sp.]